MPGLGESITTQILGFNPAVMFSKIGLISVLLWQESKMKVNSH